jgi:hypothetical protein
MEVAMVESPPIQVEIEREDDGRILASVPDLPGVMAYGCTDRYWPASSSAATASRAR